MSIDILAELTSYALLAFLATALWAPLLIDLLYKMNFVVKHVLAEDRMNSEFIRLQAHKSGTPTMGGLMISVTVIVLTLLFVKETALRDVLLIGWGMFTLYGLFDGILGIARQANKKARALDQRFEWRLFKLFLLFVIGLFVLFIARDTLGISSVTLIGDLKLDITGAGILLLAFGSVCAMYGIEITDGLDGLVTGQFLMNLVVYVVVALVLGFTTGSTDLLPYLAMLIGSSFVYLYFNINPARVFMGGTGTLPIAFTLILFAIVTNTLPVFIIMGTMFWIEFITSMLQMLSLRFRKKKIFKIAPIHHHFEAIGWSEPKVVQRFWLGASVAGLVALWVLSWMGRV